MCPRLATWPIVPTIRPRASPAFQRASPHGAEELGIARDFGAENLRGSALKRHHEHRGLRWLPRVFVAEPATFEPVTEGTASSSSAAAVPNSAHSPRWSFNRSRGTLARPRRGERPRDSVLGMKRWASISELAAERNKSPRQMRRIVAKYAKDFPSLIRREPIRKSKIEVDRRVMKQLRMRCMKGRPSVPGTRGA
jgi:hypothetical protein